MADKPFLSSAQATLRDGHQRVRPPSQPDVPHVPDHELVSPIGKGAYGEVWLGRNVFGTLRAVKLVHRRNFAEAYPFEREFKGIQKFEPVSRTHEGLIAILQIGRGSAGAYFYYVMELGDEAQAIGKPRIDLAESNSPSLGANFGASRPYVPRTVREEVRRLGRLPASQCLEIGLRLAAALQHLHEAGLVHRDIKPSNIIFVQGVPKLADIGLVTDVDEAKSFVGTMGFIPPEGPGSPQADVYGLGKVLYEMLTGKDRHEFPALPAEFLDRSRGSQPGAAQAAALLNGLNQVVLRACESNPRLRYPSAQAMGNDLLSLQRGETLRQRPSLLRSWLWGRQAARRILRPANSPEMRSRLAEVNHLFEKGHLCALGATPERLRQACRYFEQAVEQDPKFVPGYIGLFRVRLLELTALPTPPALAVSNVLKAAEALLAVVPGTAEAHMASSAIHYLNGRATPALEELRLVERMPTLSRQTQAVSHALAAALLLELGQPAAALEHLRLSERAVPTCAIGQVSLGHPYFVQGRFDLALAQYRKSIELEPRQWLGHFWSARVHEETGDLFSAIDEFEQAELRTLENEASLTGAEPRRTKEQVRVSHAALRTAYQQGGARGYWLHRLERALAASAQDAHYIATVYARLGRLEEGYAWLRRARQEGKLSGLAFDRCWNLGDPEFQALLA